MDNNTIKNKIQQAIKNFTENDLTTSAIRLFQTLGYNTDRQAPLAHKNFNEFKENYIDPVKNFNEEKALCSEWTYVDLLFQLSKEEILKQSSLFDTKQVDNTIIETYLFFAIELNNKSYTRTALSNMTREVNKLFPMPVMILFKHGKTLTLSVINRRLHKRDASKDVLEKVTQIKDINIEKPHRAHIEILFDLSFDELQRKHAFTNFVELHKAWQKTLDIKELNKVFYQKLFNWYLWTLKEVKFPQMRPESDIIDDKVHQSESLIRLITRLLFVWFMKEKGLINPDLFIESKLKQILKNFQGEKGTETIFYKAILQNLFFATLNRPIDQRKKIDKGFNPKEYGDPLVYRFEGLFKEPDKLLDYFKDIPFLNGGLFDCLDQKKDEEHKIEIRLDGFSTKKKKQVHIPDKYFFGEHKNIDLSSDYDDKKKKNITVFGLIDILNHYKFTVEESTPVEEEIALDPELLGKVFENLLASYNPETHTTARKQTGSFYTPREIVNYMVDESLIAYLKNSIDDKDRLRELFSFSDKDELNPFNRQETQQLVKAIDSCKILDPACGSGAFPMGALQKLTHILHKLDPENKIWFDMVINNLPPYMQKDAREKLEKEDWNYVRKLGIIQQCIYGIDIQPIAIQIAKLRFFISLLVDQNKKSDKPNLGFEPLPNLDFKLVAANTLISAPENDAIEAFAKDSLKNFEKLTNEYFSAVNERKLQIKEEIKRSTKNIVNANQKVINQWIEKIKRENNSASPAKQKKMQKQMDEFQQDLDRWNTYPNIYKNESVRFFETKYFFPQVTNGFDVVLGNPPYIKENTDRSVFDGLRNSPYYQGKMDLWYFFACRSIDFLSDSPKGSLAFIATNNWITNSGASKLRNKILTETRIKRFVDFSDFKIFESAGIQTMVFILEKEKNIEYHDVSFSKILDSSIRFSELNTFLKRTEDLRFTHYVSRIITSEFIGSTISFSSKRLYGLLSKIDSTRNFEIRASEINSGIDIPQDFLSKSNQQSLGGNYQVGQGVFVLSQAEIDNLNLSENEHKLLRPFYTTSELNRYSIDHNNLYWIIYTNSSFRTSDSMDKFPKLKSHLDQFQKIITSENKPYGLNRARNEKFFKGERIVVQRKCPLKPSFVYVNFDTYFNRTFLPIKTDRINLRYLTSILNSSLSAFWLKHKGKMQGDNYQVDKDPILTIPIKKSQDYQQTLATLVSIAISSSDSQLLESIIDSVVFNLYFPDHMKEREIDVLVFVERDINETMQGRKFENLSDTEKEQVIEQLHQIWTDPDNEVVKRMAQFKEKSPDILKIILES